MRIVHPNQNLSKPIKKPKGKKRIKKIGKVGRQWWATRQEWISQNLPDSGYWICRYCGKYLTLDLLTLDHIIPRSRAPHLRFDHENLAPACWECNSQKGSLVYEDDC